MSELFSNNAVSTLAGSLAAIGTSVTVQAGHGARFPSPGASDFFRLVLVRKSDGAWEIVFCTARSGDIFTITRAQESTVALALVSGDVLELRPTAGFFTSLTVTSSAIQNNQYIYDATDTGSANVCIIQPSPAIAAYVEGQEFWFKVGVTNTGASTLNVSALGTSPAIILPNGSALYAGALQATRIAHVVHNGTAWVLQNPYNFASVAGLITRTHTDINNLVTLAGAETLTNKTLNGAVSGTSFVDEDNMASNSDTRVPTQQSVKAYVDNKRGAAVYASTDESIPNNTSVSLSFNSELYDTDGIHDNVTNNSRLTVPAGVTNIRLRYIGSFTANATGYRSFYIIKNGGTPNAGIIEDRIGGSSSSLIVQHIATPILTVVAGDFFQVRAYQNSGGTLLALGTAYSSFFEMEIIR